MAFTLLLKTPHGWTDGLGCNNEWPSEADALAGAQELDKVWGTSSEWKVVPSNELHLFELIA
jgi:hypothetical protein